MASNAEMVVVPNGSLNNYSLRFNRVTIEWTLHSSIPPMPVAINWGKLGEDCDLITISDVVYRRGRHSLTIPKGYEFDGASIPRIFRWAPGYERVGRHIWAALAHDYVCDRPWEADLPRVMGDALFVTLLLETGVSRRQSKLMYSMVRLWSIYRAWRMGEGESGPITEAVEAAGKVPSAAKATAVSKAAEVAKAETTVVPCKENCGDEAKEEAGE